MNYNTSHNLKPMCCLRGCYQTLPLERSQETSETCQCGDIMQRKESGAVG